MNPSQKYWKVSLDFRDKLGFVTYKKYFTNQMDALKFGELLVRNEGSSKRKEEVLSFVTRVTDLDEIQAIRSSSSSNVETDFPFSGTEYAQRRMPDIVLNNGFWTLEVKVFESSPDSTNALMHESESIEFAFEDRDDLLEFSKQLNKAYELAFRLGAKRVYCPQMDLLTKHSHTYKDTDALDRTEFFGRGQSAGVLDIMKKEMFSAVPAKPEIVDPDVVWSFVVCHDEGAPQLREEVLFFESKEDAEVMFRIIRESFERTIKAMGIGDAAYEKANPDQIEAVLRPHVPEGSVHKSGDIVPYAEAHFENHGADDRFWTEFLWTIGIRNSSGNEIGILSFPSYKAAARAFGVLERDGSMVTRMNEAGVQVGRPYPRSYARVNALSDMVVDVGDPNDVMDRIARSGFRGLPDFSISSLEEMINKKASYEADIDRCLNRFCEEIRPQLNKFLPQDLHALWSSSNISRDMLKHEDGYVAIAISPEGSSEADKIVYAGFFPEDMFNTDAAVRKEAIRQCEVISHIPDNVSKIGFR